MKTLFATFRQTLFGCALLGGMTLAHAQSSNTPPSAPEQPLGERSAPTAQRMQGQIQGGSPILRVLTPEQRAQMRLAMEANHEAVQDLQERIQTARKELLELQLAEKLDEAAFRTKSEEIVKAQAEVELFNAHAFAKVRPSLTPEQVDQIRRQLNNPARRYGGPEARPGVFPQGAPAAPPLHRPLSLSNPIVVPPSMQK